MAHAPRTREPLQNRGTPTGELASVAERGLLMGNRGGQFHRADRTLGRRRWASRAWIACVLDWQDRHEDIWVDRHYTQLFFLDEATALATGHRPCGYCRRADYRRFAALWAAASGLPEPPKAPLMDDRLHAERWASRGTAASSPEPLSGLPDGAMVMHADAPHLLHAGRLWPWSFAGYGAGVTAAGVGRAVVITPPSILAILRAGYHPLLHPSAR